MSVVLLKEFLMANTPLHMSLKIKLHMFLKLLLTSLGTFICGILLGQPQRKLNPPSGLSIKSGLTLTKQLTFFLNSLKGFGLEPPLGA